MSVDVIPASDQPSGALGEKGNVKVTALLVTMPFFTAARPSLQIGQLAAIGNARGHRVATLHLTLDFAAKIGPDLYEQLCLERGHELGNWLFAEAAFGADAPSLGKRFLEDFPQALTSDTTDDLDVETLLHIRHQLVPGFLDAAMALVDWGSYRAVGFSSTFQQNVASFALARRIKARHPDLTVLFGGGNFDGEMGPALVRTCPWIDFAVNGEGDTAFPMCLDALAEGRDLCAIPGVISREQPSPRCTAALTHLEKLPVPDFEEYFVRAELAGLLKPGGRRDVEVPFEASRGCWWGQKHHCTFCGVNGAIMKFRQKSAARVLEELSELSRRHSVYRFFAADNIIPMDFIRELAPALARQARDYEIFFEVKANLSREQIKALRDGGILSVQPGIESFSSHVLRLMEKGVKAVQNVNFLRWARYYGIEATWNIIWGFPGETAEHVALQTALLPHLVHLEPPSGLSRIVVERFSPHHDDRKRFPVRRIEPEASLRYIYPAGFDLERIAYSFDHEFEDELPDEAFEPLRAAGKRWQRAWAGTPLPWLTYRWSPGMLHVEDGREVASPKLYSFTNPVADIYAAISNAPLTAGAVCEKLQLDCTTEDVTEALDLLATRGLVMKDEGLYLALAIPQTPNR